MFDDRNRGLYPRYRYPYRQTARIDPDLDRAMGLAVKARCRTWQFTVDRHLGRISLRVFYPDPILPCSLRMGGPWPLPDDCGLEEVRDAALRAVESILGPVAARLEFSYGDR